MVKHTVHYSNNNDINCLMYIYIFIYIYIPINKFTYCTSSKIPKFCRQSLQNGRLGFTESMTSTKSYKLVEVSHSQHQNTSSQIAGTLWGNDTMVCYEATYFSFSHEELTGFGNIRPMNKTRKFKEVITKTMK